MRDVETLHAYVDRELSSEQIAAFEELMSQDAELRKQVALVQAQKMAMVNLNYGMECEDAWKKCKGRIAEIESARRTENFVSRYAWALCASLILMIVVGGGWQRLNGTSNSNGTAITEMMAGFVPNRQQNSTPAEVQRWVEGVFDFAGEATRPDRLELLAMEKGVSSGKMVERHWIKDGEGQIILIAVEGHVPMTGMTPASEDGKYMVGHVGKANCIGWYKPNYTVFLMGERPTENLKVAAIRLCSMIK